jgi:spermidine synthase
MLGPTMTAASPVSSQVLAAEGRRARALPLSLTVSLFVASGATALIDQVCFSKYLGYVVGTTAYAVSAVLAAFMTGLCIGAHLGGKWSRHVRRPLAAYGALELVVAAAVALSPVAFEALTPAYVALARWAPDSVASLGLLRWLTAVFVVIVPTTAMGATLPLLSRALGEGDATSLDQARQRERHLGALYAANTMGGALGALAAAYAVLPALGLKSTLLASALISALVGVVAYTVGKRRWVVDGAEAPPSAPATREARRGSGLLLLAALAFVSGALVFAAEVVFTHLLALIVGNSAFAFGLILAVFLICLFFGASLAPVAERRLGAAALPLGLALTGLALSMTLPLWDDLPSLFSATGEAVTSFAAREVVRALAAFAILLVPTTMMGLTFPLVLQKVAARAAVGERVGRLTAINTIGAVFGALSGGYLLLPLLGSERALLALALSYLVAAALVARAERRSARRGTRVALVLSALALAAIIAAPRWSLAKLTNGANVYFDPQVTPERILFVREDVHGGVTTVTETKGVRTLYTNGKFQGNTGWEMKAQRMLSHYPSLFVERFDEALIIGLGTATTLGTVATYPWRRIDVIEISPAIVEAAGRFFREQNLGALDDPRVTLHLEDGRNHLLVSERRYDFIGIELSSIWFAGASNLYSREFYALTRAHLKPGAIFQQWVQLHHIYERDFATILYTLRAEFAHVALFYGGGQGILVASDEPLSMSLGRVRALALRPQLLATVPEGRPLETLIEDMLLVDRTLDAFLADTAAAARVPLGELVSSDDNLYLEYRTPRGNVLPWSAREALVSRLQRYRDRDRDALAALVEP